MRAARASVALLAWGLLLVAPAAHADPTKDECIEANAKGQDLRRDGKILQARAAFAACAVAACPRIVRSDCTKRLDEAETAQPTVAFEVKDASGRDAPSVACTLDGVATPALATGAAIPVDPGKHEVSFAAAGLTPVTRTIVVTEGEKERREKVVLAAPTAVGAGSAPVAAPAPSTSRAGGRGQRAAGFAVGGGGVAGIALGAIFGSFALSKKSQQQTDCASPTSCTSHADALGDHSTGTTDATISTIGFVAGGALLAGGLALVFTAKSGDARAEPAPRALSLAPSVGPGGGGVLIRGEF